MKPSSEREESAALALRIADRSLLLVPSIAFLIGVGLADLAALSRGEWFYWVSALLAGAYLALARGRRSTWVGIALLAGCFAALGFARLHAVLGASGVDWGERIPDEGMLVHLRGEVLSEPEARGAEKHNPWFPLNPERRFVFHARCRPWSEQPDADAAAPTVRVSVVGAEPSVQIGDTIEVRGRLYALRGPRNPGETDWRRIARLDGVAAGVHVENASLMRVVARSPGAAEAWRTRTLALLGGALHGDGPVGDADVGDRLLDAIILGQRSAIERNWNEIFARAGAVHFLSVSGFHIGTLALSAAWLASWIFRASHRGSAVAALLIVAAYLSFAEWNAPILRAAVLTLCFVGAAWLSRANTPMNWLCAAALLLAFIDPREVMRPGFQLCFSQVAVLVWLVPGLVVWVHRPADDTGSLLVLLWRRGWRIVVDACVISVVLWLFAAPIVWFHFGQIQPWGALGSLLLTIPMTLLLWAAFALIAVRMLPIVGEWLGGPVEGLVDGLVDLNLWVVQWFAGLPGASIRAAAPSGWWIVAAMFTAVLLAGSRRWPRRGRFAVRAVAVVAGLAIVLGAASEVLSRGPSREVLTAWIFDVGNGSAAVVQSAGAPPLIVDAGTLRNRDVAELVRGATQTRGATVVLSHADLDHYSGIPGLLRDNEGALLISGEFLRRESVVDGQLATFAAALPRELATRIVVAGDSWTVGDASVEVLWPPVDAAELPDNDQSLVLRITQHGRSVLFPGDIEEFALRALADRHARGEIDLQADVLIAPHHGAVVPGATESFLAAVAPEYVVASTARATEPLAALLDRLFEGRCGLVVTERSGAVRIEIGREGTISLQTPYLFHNTQ